jgi:segregation and condensation protein A
VAEYKVKFEVFEGPLDLLLYLVKKEEVDIYQVDLTRIATQFVEYIELMRQLDLEVAGEFLVMASTLMYIKSRELLPRDQQVETEGEEDEEDPRWELIRQLVEYRKFKDAAAQLHARELHQENTFPRIPGRPEISADSRPRSSEASLFDLIAAVSQILRRVQEREGPREIFEDRFTVSEKIDQVRRLLSERSSIRFSELFGESVSRSEVVVTFLAILELMRLKQLTARQDDLFGEIELHSGEAALTDGTTRAEATEAAIPGPVESPPGATSDIPDPVAAPPETRQPPQDR